MWTSRAVVQLATGCKSRSLLLKTPPLSASLLPCRKLTHLGIRSWCIKVLPPLPPQLQQLRLAGCGKLRSLPELPPTLHQLDVSSCSKLRALPALPPTLNQLLCTYCGLEALPRSLSTSAITELDCRFMRLQHRPELPRSLLKLLVGGDSLQELPALPEGLTCLQAYCCGSLKEVSSSTLVLECSLGDVCRL